MDDRRYPARRVRAAARSGAPAAVAVGHQILTIAYHLLRRQEDYHEALLADLEERRRNRARERALDQLRQLGFEVTITPKQAAA